MSWRLWFDYGRVVKIIIVIRSEGFCANEIPNKWFREIGRYCMSKLDQFALHLIEIFKIIIDLICDNALT